MPVLSSLAAQPHSSHAFSGHVPRIAGTTLTPSCPFSIGPRASDCIWGWSHCGQPESSSSSRPSFGDRIGHCTLVKKTQNAIKSKWKKKTKHETQCRNVACTPCPSRQPSAAHQLIGLIYPSHLLQILALLKEEQEWAMSITKHVISGLAQNNILIILFVYFV